jgi:hypothetical protein
MFSIPFISFTFSLQFYWNHYSDMSLLEASCADDRSGHILKARQDVNTCTFSTTTNDFRNKSIIDTENSGSGGESKEGKDHDEIGTRPFLQVPNDFDIRPHYENTKLSKRRSIHWRPLIRMGLCLISGTGLAIIHDLFYSTVKGRESKSGEQQQGFLRYIPENIIKFS